MLTYAIGFVLDVELVCFAAILVSMALHDRGNRSLRWLAFGYLAGFGGALIDLLEKWLPHWISWGVVMEAPIIGYGCFYLSVALFARRGERARWIPALLVGGALPFFIRWSVIAGHMSQSATLQDGILAVETALTAILLFTTLDRETRWPRRTMGIFLTIYSVVEFIRVGIYLATGKMPDVVAPWVENASGCVYVVSCAALPLAFIWMMNARLLVHLSRLTMVDPLTELLNRRGLQAAAEEELARYARSQQDFAVVVLDLDYFKQINDHFGHEGGDAVLCGVSLFLRNMVRETDVVSRMGGEEFVLFLPGTSASAAFAIIERLRIALMEHSFPMGTRQARVTASFGITVSAGREYPTWERLQHEADLALYAAKRAGRNNCRFYEESQGADSLGYYSEFSRQVGG
jgi:diguanylate cyclase (GGDEF)-like protein